MCIYKGLTLAINLNFFFGIVLWPHISSHFNLFDIYVFVKQEKFEWFVLLWKTCLSRRMMVKFNQSLHVMLELHVFKEGIYPHESH